MTRFHLRRAMIAGVAMIAVAGVSAPASAQLFGGIVYDPNNYAQNVLMAARSLQQITNQIQSLPNASPSLVVPRPAVTRPLTFYPPQNRRMIHDPFSRAPCDDRRRRHDRRRRRIGARQRPALRRDRL